MDNPFPRSLKPARPTSSLSHLALGAIGCAFLISTIALAQIPAPAAPQAQEPSKDQGEAEKKATDKAPVERPAIQEVPVPQGAEQNLNDMIDGMTEECRPCLLSEIHFLRAACGRKAGHGNCINMSAEQRQTIIREAGLLLKETATTIATLEHKKMQEAQADRTPPVDQAYKRIQDGVKTIAKARLSPALWDRYHVETKKRSEARKRVAIGIVVARLDRQLLLSPEQRDQILVSLSTCGKDDWLRSLDPFDDDSPNFPLIPDQKIVPFLSSTQQKVWASLEKQQSVDSQHEFFRAVYDLTKLARSEDDLELDKTVPKKAEAQP
jgi:hypothetical protein